MAGGRGRRRDGATRAAGARRAGRAATRGDEGRDALDVLRRRIDAIDRKLVGLLNERAAHAITLGRVKKERGLPIYQPSREEEVLRNVQESNAGPLEDAALRRLFERIIDESRHIERVATAAPEETAAGRGPAREPGPGKPAPSSD